MRLPITNLHWPADLCHSRGNQSAARADPVAILRRLLRPGFHTEAWNYFRDPAREGASGVASVVRVRRSRQVFRSRHEGTAAGLDDRQEENYNQWIIWDIHSVMIGPTDRSGHLCPSYSLHSERNFRTKLSPPAHAADSQCTISVLTDTHTRIPLV